MGGGFENNVQEDLGGCLCSNRQLKTIEPMRDFRLGFALFPLPVRIRVEIRCSVAFAMRQPHGIFKISHELTLPHTSLLFGNLQRPLSLRYMAVHVVLTSSAGYFSASALATSETVHASPQLVSALAPVISRFRAVPLHSPATPLHPGARTP